MLIGDDGSNDAEHIRIALDAQLKARRIDDRAFEASDDGRIMYPATTEEFVPDATLRIAPNLTIRTEAGERGEVHVDASLYLPGDTRTGFGGAMIHSASSANADAAAGTPRWAIVFAKRVVDQLFLDGVLR